MKTSFQLLTSITLLAICACPFWDIHAAQGKARKTGTLVGVVVDKGNNKNMNNGWVEVKADGEEKGRKYWPVGDPKVGGPDRDILKAIRAVAIGSRVELQWVDAGDGKDISRFQVLNAAK